VRHLLKELAAEGRAVFVSSHLMSEMALTADHLIVIGRGRLIADTSVEELVSRASGDVVLVRSPEAEKLRDLVVDDGVTVISSTPGALEVHGLTAAKIGEVAAANGVVLHELTPQQVSLEQAFMDMTRDDVEFRTADLVGAESS
jgi:ABC-2 type transport system ATP-binding protein